MAKNELICAVRSWWEYFSFCWLWSGAKERQHGSILKTYYRRKIHIWRENSSAHYRESRIWI